MSSEIEKPNIPQAPVLYGIDPSVTYKWVPPKFRKEFRDKLADRVWESIKDIKDEKERQIVIRRDYVDFLRGRQVAMKGSPWVEVGPLSSDLSLRLELANATYRNRLALANAETEREIEAVRATKAPAKRKDQEIKAIQRRAEDENAARGYASFDSGLIQEVLSEAVRTWSGFVKPLSPEKRVDSTYLLRTNAICFGICAATTHGPTRNSSLSSLRRTCNRSDPCACLRRQGQTGPTAVDPALER
jgi:hypothetical protein